jgi:hypothetical protein
LRFDGPTETEGLLLAARGRERKKGRGRQKPAAHNPNTHSSQLPGTNAPIPDFGRITDFSSLLKALWLHPHPFFLLFPFFPIRLRQSIP